MFEGCCFLPESEITKNGAGVCAPANFVIPMKIVELTGLGWRFGLVRWFYRVSAVLIPGGFHRLPAYRLTQAPLELRCELSMRDASITLLSGYGTSGGADSVLERYGRTGGTYRGRWSVVRSRVACRFDAVQAERTKHPIRGSPVLHSIR